MSIDSLKILILEDNPTDAGLILRIFRKEELNYKFRIAGGKNDYLIALEDFTPDIILSDHSLPGFSSTEALKISRQLYPKIPFILVTGAVSEEFAADIIKLGADDYILKDRMGRLPSAIVSVLNQRHLERENIKILDEARRKIELAEERERVAIEAADIGIYDLNMITGEVVTSRRYNQIFGFTESMPMDDYLAAIHPDDASIRTDAFEKSKSMGRLNYEVRLINKDQTITWIKAAGIVHKNEQGMPARIIGSILDITEFKYLLKQKDNFIAICSHELRTPVTTVKAYTHILEKMIKQRENVTEMQLIQKIDNQVSRLSGLINTLLDSTKLIAGQIDLNSSEFKIDDLVRDIITDLLLTTDKEIIIQLSASHCEIHADREKIGQIIINLVNNAIKFSGASNKIIVKTIKESNKVKLEVQDFGIGIKKENIEKIFHQFYRENHDFKYTFPGLGLGLFISSEIIKKEGGEIMVESTEGKGSTFSVLLPCA